MLTLRASSDIDAPIETVFDVMMDFRRYAEWNPFVVGITGEARVGEMLTLDVHFYDRRRNLARERIDVLSAPGDSAELTYAFTGLLDRFGLVRGKRRQLLTRLEGGRTHYETVEAFTGLLTRFLPRAGIQRGFDDVAAAIKARAEQVSRR